MTQGMTIEWVRTEQGQAKSLTHNMLIHYFSRWFKHDLMFVYWLVSIHGYYLLHQTKLYIRCPGSRDLREDSHLHVGHLLVITNRVAHPKELGDQARKNHRQVGDHTARTITKPETIPMELQG